MLAGAVRAAEEIGRLLGTWRTAPLQALARLHVLAAAELVPAERHGAELGRPADRRTCRQRLALLADLVTGGTRCPAPVLVAVVHGELLALAPVPRPRTVWWPARRPGSTAVATGLDPKGLAVPEVGHLRRARRVPGTAAGFAAGHPEGSPPGCGTAVRSGRPGRARGCRSPTPAPERETRAT